MSPYASSEVRTARARFMQVSSELLAEHPSYAFRRLQALSINGQFREQPIP